jgi:hypothetical protein
MPGPTFFIVGAPKCGTTALYNWLSGHPQACMSQPKEPQFFAEDILGHQRNITNLEDYLRCFENNAQTKQLGEASTCYLASPSAAQQIKTFSPRGKIVAMLRNPVEVMYSLHSERVFGNMENIRDFGSAVDSAAGRTWTAGRFRGQRVLRPSYREMVRFSEQVQRYINVFGRDRVHVILYEDLLASAAEVYRGTLDFLELERDRRNGFEVVNDNKRARSLTLHGFVRHPGKTIRRMGHLVLPKPVRGYVSGVVNRLNTVQEPRPALNPDLRRRLVKEFEPEIQALSVLLGRDLSTWCKD